MNASELLQVWEVGRGLPPLERVIFLLTCAGWQDAGSLTVGQKNRALISMYEQLFSPQLACVAHCPRCSTQLEFGLSTTLLASSAEHEPQQTLTLDLQAYTLTVRQPQLRDLQIAEGRGASLYERCVVEARSGKETVAFEMLPESARLNVAEALLLDDPMLDIQLALDCPECGASWKSPLDLLAFLWQEIERWGQRMLYTIHRLASAYGWSEEEILALSAWRRNGYLDLINHG